MGTQGMPCRSPISTAGVALITLVAVAIIAIGGIAIDRLDRSCWDIFPNFDTRAVRMAEAHELLHQAHDDPMAPAYALKVVGIAGRTATMVVSEPVYEGNGEYARVWERVYANRHGGKIVCVHLHLIWKGGAVTQEAPIYPSL